ncbi:MAG: thiamine phosphate synthase [Candidatus Brocadiaceae bacterium]|nr:thiamine phosphate synthase [Candidatus Brocadiaceae bacterium]
MNRHSKRRRDSRGIAKRFIDARLYVLISSHLCHGSVLKTLQEVMRGGADIVQLREKTMGESEYLALAKEFRKLTLQSGILFIVNDHAEIAREVDADGLHIGQSDCCVQSARKIIGNDRVLGVSTHNMAQARRAERAGADYISVGPVYPTETKDFEPPVGLEYIRQVKEGINIPSVAIGAINHDNLHDVIHAGGERVAICSAILCRENVAEATILLKNQIIFYRSQIRN